MDKNCLINVIGLSESQCPCLPDSGSINTAESLSGLYVDNMQYGIDLKVTQSIEDCGSDGIWAIMDRARKEAINEFITLFQLSLDRHKLPKYQSYNGFFGEHAKSGNSYRSGTRNINGFCLFPKEKICGATICITEIELGISAMDDYDVIIINENTGDTVYEQVVTVNSLFKGVVSGLNIELPMTDECGQMICYSFSYDTKGAKPRDFKFHCGCSSVPLPNWMTDKLIAAKGFSVNSVVDITEKNCNSDYTNGLIVKWKVKCDPFDWMCSVDPSFWCDTNFGRLMAMILVLMTNAKIGSSIVKAQNVNFFTLLSQEQLYGKIQSNNRIAKELIDKLASSELPTEMERCLRCNPKTIGGFRKQEIII